MPLPFPRGGIVVIVSLLVAMDERRGIGIENRLPWRLSADLRQFKALTMGHHLIMGRKTFESIGRPLPGRTSIVVTRNPAFLPKGCLLANSLESALDLARARGEDEAFVIGGGQIFARALPFADRIYLTQVHATGKADVFFPEFSLEDWVELNSYEHPADEKNEHAFTFRLLERRWPDERPFHPFQNPFP
jgi:dihydrofolate reductase